MCGSATLTIDVSRTSSVVPSITASAISHLWLEDPYSGRSVPIGDEAAAAKENSSVRRAVSRLNPAGRRGYTKTNSTFGVHRGVTRIASNQHGMNARIFWRAGAEVVHG